MSRLDNSKQKWLEKGYEHFALFGPENISINAISKEIDSTRSSFYHHFSDMEVFFASLLESHYQLTKQFIVEGKQNCKKLIPDLYILLEKFSLGLKFNRQLFVNRHIPSFGFMFNRVFEKVTEDFVLDLFVHQFNLQLERNDVASIWLTLTESWYARINPENLEASELQMIAEDIMNSIMKFIGSDLHIFLSDIIYMSFNQIATYKILTNIVLLKGPVFA